MKKIYILIFLLLSNVFSFAQEFVFPPELKWWLDEIQTIDKNISLDKFKFLEEEIILNEDIR